VQHNAVSGLMVTDVSAVLSDGTGYLTLKAEEARATTFFAVRSRLSLPIVKSTKPGTNTIRASTFLTALVSASRSIRPR
jgi:hypothetical protein